MPIFEYICAECESKFELLAKNSGDNKVACPECNSSKIKKLFSAFSAATSKDRYQYNSCTSGNCSEDVPNAGGCAGGMCGLN